MNTPSLRVAGRAPLPSVSLFVLACCGVELLVAVGLTTERVAGLDLPPGTDAKVAYRSVS